VVAAPPVSTSDEGIVCVSSTYRVCVFKSCDFCVLGEPNHSRYSPPPYSYTPKPIRGGI
jgi:hypothetical protein